MNDQAQRLRELAQQHNSVLPSSGPGGVRKVARSPKTVQSAHAISVCSGKGGVGKSNIALSLALALTKLGKRVLLFDADLGLANIHVLLGIAPVNNLSHFISGNVALEDIVCEGPAGISILPGATGLTEIANLQQSHLQAVLQKLGTIEQQYDMLLLDIGAGVSSQTIQLSAYADTALLVMTPEPTSLTDAYATAKILIQKGTTRIRVMVNMAGDEKEGRAIFEKLSQLTRKFLHAKLELAAVLPIDRTIPRLVRMQKTMMLERPSSPFAVRIRNYARVLCGMPVVRKEGFFSRIFNRDVR
ncbi:MAG: MinD/ParA family protein [Fibrobacterota bacterium]